MKIALFHMGFMYSGGGERTVIYENLSLKKQGHHVTCFAPTFRPEVCHPDLIRKIDLKGFLPKLKVPLPLRDFLSLGLSSFMTPFFTHKFLDFDVILCHGQPTTWIGYSVAKNLHKPYVSYLHQPARFLYPRPIDLKVKWRTKKDFALLNDLAKMAKPLAKAWDHISVTSSNAVLANSRWTSALTEKIYGRKPIVCPPGVDVERYRPAPRLSEIEVNDRVIKGPFILSTNRHYPQKGLKYFLLMMPKVLTKCNVQLVITGASTGYKTTLWRLADELKIRDKVIFTKQVSENDLIKLYQNAEVYAYSSPYEDFGLGPIEAMACGTPAVVWNYAGPRETVIDGATGFKAKPYSVNDFADKVTRLLTDEKLNREMGANAADFVKKNYPWDKHAKILETVLLDALVYKI
ncbi:MAG: glycosyltransferase family 4 protein [Candidatus Bathyarchaeia archaeon]